MVINWITLFVALPILILTAAFIAMSRMSRSDYSKASVSQRPFLWTVTALLSLLFLIAGLPKLVGVDAVMSQFSDWGFSPAFMVIVGVVEIVGAVLLLFPTTASIAAAALAVVMVGAIVTHAMAGELIMTIVPILMLLGLGWVGWTRAPYLGAGRLLRRSV